MNDFEASFFMYAHYSGNNGFHKMALILLTSSLLLIRIYMTFLCYDIAIINKLIHFCKIDPFCGRVCVLILYDVTKPCQNVSHEKVNEKSLTFSK